MKYFFVSFITTVFLSSPCLLASNTDVFVFLGDSPLKGIEISLDNTLLGSTDDTGASSFELGEGKHNMSLVKDNKQLASWELNLGEEQDVEISVILSKNQAPNIQIVKIDENGVQGNAAGFLKGTIANKEGEVVSGATVILSPGNTRTTSDETGTYAFDVTRGIYQLSVSHPDYSEVELENIRVVANVGTAAFVTLPKRQQATSENKLEISRPNPIEEIFVLASFSSSASSVSIEQSSAKIVDAVDIEELARFGDVSVAGALKRVVGVSIVDGKYAVVRALDGRYNSALFNNMLVPSTDPMRRDVQLDLFPSSMLKSIEIQKTFSAEIPGNSTGGVIKINTKTPSRDGGFNQFNVSVGYNDGATGEDYISYQGSGSDKLGYDDGLRDLPSNIRNATNNGLDFLVCDPQLDPSCTSEQDAAALGKSFNNSYNTLVKSASPEYGLSYVFGNGFEIGSVPFDFYGAVGYKQKTKVRQNAVLNTSSFTGDYQRSMFEVSADAYLAMSASLTENTEINSKTTVLRKTEDTTKRVTGVDQEDVGVDEVLLQWVEREFFAQQLSGSHSNVFFTNEDKFSWNLGFSQSNRDEPDRRTYQYRNQRIFESTLERRFSTLTEDSTDLSFDYLIPIDFSTEIATELRVGTLYSNKERVVDLLRFGLDRGAGFEIEPEQTLEDVASADNFDNQRVRLAVRTTKTDSYESINKITAGYLNTETKIGEKFTVLAGARLEEFSQELLYPNQETSASLLESDKVLPAFTLTWHQSNDLQIRAGLSQTVSYPGIIERSESLSYDPETDRAIIGNPDLVVSEIDNIDLRVEYYIGESSNLALALFSKDILNPIEKATPDSSGSQSNGITYRNANRATVNGVELDFNAKLFDRDSFSTFFSGNITWVDSEVELDSRSAQLEGEESGMRDLQGQSPLLANIQFGFDHFATNQKITLLGNFFDDRIDRVVRGQLDNEYEKGRLQLDLNYQIDFTENSSLKLKVKNLSNEPVEYIQNGVVIERYDNGLDLSLSFKQEF